MIRQFYSTDRWDPKRYYLSELDLTVESKQTGFKIDLRFLKIILIISTRNIFVWSVWFTYGFMAYQP